MLKDICEEIFKIDEGQPYDPTVIDIAALLMDVFYYNEGIGVEVEVPEGVPALDYFEQLISDSGYIDYEYTGWENTYNFNAPVSHDMDYRWVDNVDGKTLVYLKLHRKGDVRANYTEGAILEVDTIDDFHIALEEFSPINDFEYRGKEFQLAMTPFSEYVQIWYEDGSYNDEFAIVDYDELKEYLDKEYFEESED